MDSEIDAFAEYLRSEKNRSGNTLKAYLTDLFQLRDFLLKEKASDFDVESVSYNDLSLFVGHRYDCGDDRMTLRRKIAAIKSFYSFLSRNDYIKKNPAKMLPFPKKKYQLPKFLKIKQSKSFVEIEDKDFKALRDRAIFELFFSTGARVSEIASIKIRDIDIDKKQIKVTGKGSYERFVFLTDDACNYLKKYLSLRENYSDDSTLFLNLKGGKLTERGLFHIIVKRSEECGFGNYVTPHVFRHTFATEILNNGADIKTVQDLLGHKSITATQIYTHTTKRRLKDIYTRFHPHAEESKDN
ncbi:MAG: tyrosine-type recombinase/integrase [Spirochaetes bacterium]|nr:tyrosine-type recombinase/integrase [Spirochaetota bacterium]